MYACHVNDYEWYNHMFILTPQVVYAAARMVIPVSQENKQLTTYELRVKTVRWNRNRDSCLSIYIYSTVLHNILTISSEDKQVSEHFYNV